MRSSSGQLSKWAEVPQAIAQRCAHAHSSCHRGNREDDGVLEDWYGDGCREFASYKFYVRLSIVY